MKGGAHDLKSEFQQSEGSIMRRLVVVVAALAASLSAAAAAQADSMDEHEWEGVVYDSFELDEERSIDEVTVTQTSDRLAIRLTLDRETLTIDARPNSEASNGPLSSGALAYVSEPNEEGVGFNIMYLPDQYVVGSSYSVSQSPSDRDGIGRLAFTAAPSGDVEEMIAATTQAEVTTLPFWSRVETHLRATVT